MRRFALVVAMTIFAATLAGGRGGMIGRWLMLAGLLVSERLAAFGMPRAALSPAKRPASELPIFPIH
jgi:hypothetical protein